MHRSSLLRMKWFAENYVAKIDKKEIRILDVGSYDVNGSYKTLFPEEKYKYTGLDLENGPNVDIVPQNSYDWNEIPTDSFDVVISGQALEHIEFFWVTVAEMTRVLKKDGLLCLIAPQGFSEHRYPVDCYRFFSDGMVALARYVNLELLHAHTNCAPSEKDTRWYSQKNADSLLIARKPYDGEPKYVNLKEYKCIPVEQEKIRDGFLSYQDFRKKLEMESPPVPVSKKKNIINNLKSLLQKIT